MIVGSGVGLYTSSSPPLLYRTVDEVEGHGDDEPESACQEKDDDVEQHENDVAHVAVSV